MARSHLLLPALLAAGLPFAARGQSIVTVAGGGTDEGRNALARNLNQPYHMAVDGAGNLYVADYGNNRVLRIAVATGLTTTVAGNGVFGFAGDGGPATLASLARPYGLAVDGSGNLLISDNGNDRVRRVSASTGVIATVAGGGTGDDGRPAVEASLSRPDGIALDGAGNLYIADYGHHRVRVVSASTGIISTVAGDGTKGSSGDGLPATSASVGYPSCVAVDASGSVFVGLMYSSVLRKVSSATGVITTFAGDRTYGFGGDGGPATAATFSEIWGVKVDRAGNVLVADSANNRIRRISASTGIVTTIVGNGTRGPSGDGGPATAAGIYWPEGIALDQAGDLYVSEAGAGRIRRVSAASGFISTIAGGGSCGDGGAALSAILAGPTGVAVDRVGNVYLADPGNHRVRVVGASTGVISTVAGTGIPGFAGDGGPGVNASLDSPYKLALDQVGNVYIADMWNDRVRRVAASTGVISTLAGGGTGGDGGPADRADLDLPAGIALDQAGNVYLTEADAARVRKVAAGSGVITTVAGTGTWGFSGDGGPATAAKLRPGWGVAVDSAGDLFITDTSNGRVRKVTASTGIITSVAGGGQGDDGGPATAAILTPVGIALDPGGSLLVTDVHGNRVRRVSRSTGIISTAAGSGSYLSSGLGEGGLALAAGLGRPADVSTDAAGRVYIADTFSNRIRAVGTCAAPGPPPLVSPADAGTVSGTAVSLSWTPVPEAFSFEVLLDTVNPPAKSVAELRYATPSPFHVPPGTVASYLAQNLAPGTRYFWRVVAKGDPFCTPKTSASSTVRSFTTAAACTAPAQVLLSAPADGASVPGAVTLSWAPSPGAGTYDVYFGAGTPPPLAASGLTATSYTPSGLVGGGRYYWSVLARASCDPAKTASSAVRSFQLGGVGCMPPRAFALSAPADGATGVPPDVTLAWTSSVGASSYDVHLGPGTSPPLHLPGLTSTSVTVRGLLPGAAYRWKVVARTACDPKFGTETVVRSFTVAGTCTAPGATSFSFVPPGAIGAGQTYVVAWSAATGLGAGGGYLVERSTSPSFAPLLDSVTTTSRFASFDSRAAGALHHRVRAVPSCDPTKAGPWSAAAVVTVVSAKPNVVFSRSPEAVVTALGERLEDRKATFALENVTSSRLQVLVARQELSSVPFFTIADPAGGDAAFVTLEPRAPKLLEVRFSGPSNDVPGSYAGLIVVAATGAGLAVTPYAFVSLKVGSSPDAVPEFRLGGVATEYAAFPGLSGDDSSRAPISVDVHNPGPSPLDLAAEVGPEVWLSLEPGWNSTPIPPGGSRPLRLTTRRIRAPNGSALPRYTYLTLRTKGGKSARLLVQDNDAPLLSSGRGASAVRPEASFLVPSVAHVTSALGNTFVSRLSLSNSGTEAVQAELVFTPASSDSSLVDGFGPATRRATVVVPPNDVVRLSDPLVLLFGLTPPVSGTLEVRTAAERAGFLSVSSSVDAPSPGGGTFGFALPVFRSGEGLRAGSSAAIAAVASDASERTNLILAETTGVDVVVAKVSLLDSAGTLRGSEAVTVPRWGQRQLSRVVERLGGATGSRASRLEVAVESGGGTLAAVTTVVDNANDDAATFPARAVAAKGAASTTLHALPPAWARATGTVQSLVPALVNGYQTFPAAAAPFTFRSVMGFSSLSSAEALFRLTYHDLASGSTIAREVRVPGRKTVEYTNVLEQLFGIAKAAKSQGPLFVESDPQGLLWCRVASSLQKGTIGDSFPVIPIPSEGLTGAASARLLALDGLEQSVDASRGTRSNLILNEVAGRPASLLVSLYEAGNRSSPVAQRTVSLQPLEKLQLSTVFSELGLDSQSRRKDRTNVLCTVTATSGDGLVSALVTTIDNRTGDTRNIPLTPVAAGAPGATIGF